MRSIIYARVSSFGDRQNNDRQVADLLQYAKTLNLEVVRTFEEHASGAKRTVDRPVLQDAIRFCQQQNFSAILVSELSRIGRNAFEVLAVIKQLKDDGINLVLQKEQFSLFDKDGHDSLFAPILLATLSTCAQLERDNINFRLQSGRKLYVQRGGQLGRKKGSCKTDEQLRSEYANVLTLLRKGYSIRNTAKLTGKGISTVQRLKRLL